MDKSAQTRLPGVLAPTSPNSLRPIFLAAVASALILALATSLRPYGYVVFTAETYLPLHYFAEVASVVVSFSVFAVYWHATKDVRDARGLLIGTAFLAVAVIDAMHALSFPGMPAFVTPSSVEKGIWYWLAARLWAAIALLAVTFVDPQTRNPLFTRGPLLLSNLGVAALVFIAVSFFSTYLPRVFVGGQGLTPLKIGMEYLVASLSVAASLLLLKAYRESGNQFFQRLVIALIVTTFSELAFTVYDAAYDVYNLLGHIYKVVAYYLIFDAFLTAAARQPHARLRAAFDQLDVKNRELEELNDQIENQLKRTIAELQETAQIANQRAEQLDAIIDNLTEGVVIADARGRLLRYNPAALAMAGLKPSGDLPRRIEELAALRFYHPDRSTMPEEEWPIRRALRGDRFANYEVVLVGADGIERSLAYSGSPVRDEMGQIVLAVTVSRDVTEERELYRLKDEFFLIASHELKTPLTSIKGFAQLLARKLAAAPGHEEEMRGMEIIKRQVDGMQELIERLLDVTRIQARRFELLKEPFDLAELARDVVQNLESAGEKHSLRLSGDSTVPVNADRRKIAEVFNNLISNATKYSPEGEAVDIVVEERGGEVVVAIRDYGTGIPKEKQRFIFQQFYRAAASPFCEGMGLGLYITRGIVEAHGGKIWFESPPKGLDEPAKGSIFYFSLPSTRQPHT